MQFDPRQFKDTPASRGHKVPKDCNYDSNARSRAIKATLRQALEYAKLLSSDEVWVVHFTFQDNVTEDPYWPSFVRVFGLRISGTIWSLRK
ncbi:13295_t:CDS:2 [Gigaspora margarita]|uniref:13295_t:CDS:1 n=1 Tax=Gigaspora margarita TaxID=4874 RepID=A0ABM8W2M9_GIGMA|nr:13295_t:CDS:2 [Gigaspora margarita]